jgi:hypothetical protein
VIGSESVGGRRRWRVGDRVRERDRSHDRVRERDHSHDRVRERDHSHDGGMGQGYLDECGVRLSAQNTVHDVGSQRAGTWVDGWVVVEGHGWLGQDTGCCTCWTCQRLHL